MRIYADRIQLLPDENQTFFDEMQRKQKYGENSMELNHEYQNMYIRGIIRAMNQAVEIGSISTVDFEDIVYETAHDPEHLIGRDFLDAIIQSELFDHSKKYRLKPVIPVKIVLPPTFAELQWLQHILQSPFADLFLDTAEHS